MRTPFDAPRDWRFVAGARHAGQGGDALWFLFQDGRLLVDVQSEIPLPRVDTPRRYGLAYHGDHFLGLWNGIACYCAEVPLGQELPEVLAAVDLRRFAMEVGDEDLFAMAARALQILRWADSHGFCSRCGSATVDHERDFAKVCPQCGYVQYPRISPCVIVLVTRGDHVLLARGAGFTRPMYSTLAGFVEPGETLEQAVHREVWEESGVLVKNLRYRGSQPWPFPNSLMVGFHADYAGGDLAPDPAEILDAGWYPVDRLPPVPPPGSISRRLIDEYLEQINPGMTERRW